MVVSEYIANAAVCIVAAIHFLIAFAEIFLWKRVYMRVKGFNFTLAEAEKVAPIVANAGLYNAFIAAGLVWSVCAASGSPALQLFFLACVMIAGIFGAVTLRTPNTLFMQTLPGLVAAVLVWMAAP